MRNQTMIRDLNGVMGAVSKATNEWESRFVHNNSSDGGDADEEYVKYLVRIAYLSLLSFLDKHALTSLAQYLNEKWQTHKTNLLDSYLSDFAQEPLLLTCNTFWEIINGISSVISKADDSFQTSSVIEIVTILEALPLAAHKLQIDFSKESDLDRLAEATLLTLFPDLNSNPSLTLGESFRHPDSAIPSRQTLLEYKFISSKTDVSKIIDEMQADVRNYAQQPWKHLIFAVGQNDPLTTKQKLIETITKEPSTFETIELALITHSPRHIMTTNVPLAHS